MASLNSGQSGFHQTMRRDWDDLVTELFARVISGAPFGIGVASKSKGFMGATLKLRLNQKFANRAVIEFIRKNFQSKRLDQLFSGTGLSPDPRAKLFRVSGEDTGLPKNCLVYPFENPNDSNFRGIIMFGGERLEGQLERRLEAASGILNGLPGGSKSTPLGMENHDQLLERLSKINVKRLFEYDLEILSRIVNHLEETKDDLPKNLKPIFRSVSEYILKKRLKR
jgi:hypothetical protein